MIISRVLISGLRDYHNHGMTQPGPSGASAGPKVPKLASVVGILGHLADQHAHDIKQALLAMLQVGLLPVTLYTVWNDNCHANCLIKNTHLYTPFF